MLNDHVFELVKTGCVKEFSSLLCTSFPISFSKQDEKGNSILHYLAQNRDVSSCVVDEVALRDRTMVAKKNAEGLVPLYYALNCFQDTVPPYLLLLTPTQDLLRVDYKHQETLVSNCLREGKNLRGVEAFLDEVLTRTGALPDDFALAMVNDVAQGLKGSDSHSYQYGLLLNKIVSSTKNPVSLRSLLDLASSFLETPATVHKALPILNFVSSHRKSELATFKMSDGSNLWHSFVKGCVGFLKTQKEVFGAHQLGGVSRHVVGLLSHVPLVENYEKKTPVDLVLDAMESLSSSAQNRTAFKENSLRLVQGLLKVDSNFVGVKSLVGRIEGLKQEVGVKAIYAQKIVSNQAIIILNPAFQNEG